MDAPWFNGSDTKPMESVGEPPVLCDECEREVDEGDVLSTCFGRYCGDECASKGEADFQAYMARQGFMVVDREQGE